MSYDPADRLTQTSGSVTTQFLYDGANIVGEYVGGVLAERYVDGPDVDEPVVWYHGSTTTDRRWLLDDERGSVIAGVDASAATVFVNSYDEYGQPGSSNQGRFQYTGQAWINEAALYDYKARAYLPSIGRFLQTDPIGYDAGMNLYAYVGDDPVNAVDPDGTVELPGFDVPGAPRGVGISGGSGTPGAATISGALPTFTSLLPPPPISEVSIRDQRRRYRWPLSLFGSGAQNTFHLIPSEAYQKCFGAAMGGNGTFFGNLAAAFGFGGLGAPIIEKPGVGFGGGGPSGTMTSPLSIFFRSVGIEGSAPTWLRNLGAAMSPGASRSASLAGNLGRISSRGSGIVSAAILMGQADKAAAASKACVASVGR